MQHLLIFHFVDNTVVLSNYVIKTIAYIPFGSPIRIYNHALVISAIFVVYILSSVMPV